MLKQTITTESGTYEIVYPSTNATLATTKDVATTTIETVPSIGGSFSKNIYSLNQGIGGAVDNAFNVEGQEEKYITVPSDGTWFAEVTIASLDPNQSMIVKEKIKFTVANGVYTYVEGWEAQSHQTWIKSPDGLFPPETANIWLIADNEFGSYGVRADVYGFYEPGCDYKGTIVLSQEITGGTGIPTSVPVAILNELGPNDVFGYLADATANTIFEQVTTPGRYLHKIKVYGTSGAGGQVVFYAEPVFEIQYNGTTAQLVAGYAKNILIQGDSNHDIVIETANNGFKIKVYAPSVGTTDFTATLDTPELVTSTIIDIPTIYTLEAFQFNLDAEETYPFDLVINNGAVSGGVFVPLTDGTYEFVANVKSQQYPGDFEVKITKRYEVTNNLATVTEDQTYYNLEVIADTTNGAAAAIEYGSRPVSDAVGFYVTATGYSTPSNFEGTLKVTKITIV